MPKQPTHRLNRQIRFSINPFLDETAIGSNSYSAKPSGEGLAMYFALWVELSDHVDPATGFVINVTEIDKVVRKHVIEIFSGRISEEYRNGRHVTLAGVAEMLKLAWSVMKDKFETATLTRLGLQLNPLRTIAIESEEADVFYFSEKFEFAATHTLGNETFSEQENIQAFGKCANPAGHGHNYIIEVTVKKQPDKADLSIADFQQVVEDNLLRLVDHKNLNVDVDFFRQKNPTVENITTFAWQCLNGKFTDLELDSITIWETDKTYCTYKP